MCLFLGSLVCLDREHWAGPCTPPPLPMAQASARQSSWRRCGKATRPASWETSRRPWSCTVRPCAPTHRTASCTANRSAAHLKLGQYQTALDDAVKARLLNPKWPKVMFGRGFVSFFSRLQVKTSLVLRSSSSCALYCFFLSSEKQKPSLFSVCLFVLLAFIAGTASRELEILPNCLFA